MTNKEYRKAYKNMFDDKFMKKKFEHIKKRHEECQKNSFPILKTSTVESELSNYEFSVRTYNILRRYTQCKTLEDIAQYTAKELLHIRNLGKKGLREIIKVLAENNLTLQDDYPIVYELRIVNNLNVYELNIINRSSLHSIYDTYEEASIIATELCKEHICCIRETELRNEIKETVGNKDES